MNYFPLGIFNLDQTEAGTANCKGKTLLGLLKFWQFREDAQD